MKVYLENKWKTKVDSNNPKEIWATELIKDRLGNAAIQKDSNGKPFILNSSSFINWSHNEDTIVYVISEQGKVGIDIEKDDLIYNEHLYSWILHKDEIQKIKEGTTFSEIWTRKEAILKCTGEGINENMAHFSSYQKMRFTVKTVFMNNLCISICSEFDEEIEFLMDYTISSSIE